MADGTPKYTAEQLARMTLEDINANWEDIKASLVAIYGEQQAHDEAFEKGFEEGMH